MGLFDRNPQGGALVAPAAQSSGGGGGGGITWSTPVDANIVPDAHNSWRVGDFATRFSEGYFTYQATNNIDWTDAAVGSTVFAYMYSDVGALDADFAIEGALTGGSHANGLVFQSAKPILIQTVGSAGADYIGLYTGASASAAQTGSIDTATGVLSGGTGTTGYYLFQSGNKTAGTGGGSGDFIAGTGSNAATGGKSGDAYLYTGNATAGNSGSVILTIGSAAGTQGDFKFHKVGTTVTVGHVWTATSADGKGYWAAAGGGSWWLDAVPNNTFVKFTDTLAVDRDVLGLDNGNTVFLKNGSGVGLQISPTSAYLGNNTYFELYDDTNFMDAYVNGGIGWNMSGTSFTLTSSGSSAPSLVLNNSADTFGVSIKAPAALAANTQFQLPINNGTAGYVLQTDGTGVTSWVASSSFNAAASSVSFLPDSQVRLSSVEPDAYWGGPVDGLIFDSDKIVNYGNFNEWAWVKTSDNASGKTAGLYVTTGRASVSGNSGGIQIIAGDSTAANAGGIQIKGGDGATNGGGLEFYAGNASTSSSGGGGIAFYGGGVPANYNSGGFSVQLAAPSGTGNGGGFSLSTGSLGGGASGNAGGFTFTAGNAVSGTGGGFTVNTGTGGTNGNIILNAASGLGNINLTFDKVNLTGFGHFGRTTDVASVWGSSLNGLVLDGAATYPNADGGSGLIFKGSGSQYLALVTTDKTGSDSSSGIYCTTGYTVNGASGGLDLGTGNASGTGPSGQISIVTGTTVSGTRGRVVINARQIDMNTAPDGLILPLVSSDPAAPTNGTIWYNTTSNQLKARVNGSTVVLA